MATRRRDVVQTPILQFGTSRFLQAHVDLFVSEALEKDAAAGHITVVKSSPGPVRAQRLAGLVAPEGFPVFIRGLVDGQVVDREVRVHSVRRALAADRDWPTIERIFVEEARFVVSNTGDRGYAIAEQDRRCEPERSVSFPGRLLDLLHKRYLVNARPLTVMPCELVSRNGDVLRDIITELAQDRTMPEPFVRWLTDDVHWVCSVVDRIVSEPIEPAGAVAEPYALWAIERQPRLELPCSHSAIEVVQNLECVERLKLHILNLGHTLLTHWWLHSRQPPDQTVRGALSHGATRRKLEAVYQEEVLPGFAAHGLLANARQYVATTNDRFNNPFLHHRLADISANHEQKVKRRITAFIHWARAGGDTAPKPTLQRVAAKTKSPLKT